MQKYGACHHVIFPQIIHQYKCITVRLWSKEDLEKAKSGDRWLRTLLANKTTFNQEEIDTLFAFKGTIKRYLVCFGFNEEPIKISATDDEMLYEFLNREYTGMPLSCEEIMTTYRKLENPQLEKTM